MSRKTKVYLAHSLSTTAEFEDSKRVAGELRALGYDVHVASENTSINDKTNEPSPEDIYNADVGEILDCDIFVVNVNGGHQDGTISEIGLVAGLNEMDEIWADEYGMRYKEYPIIAYTSNARLLQPQFSDGLPSASMNHLVKGMIDKWGLWCGGENAMLFEMARRIRMEDV